MEVKSVVFKGDLVENVYMQQKKRWYIQGGSVNFVAPNVFPFRWVLTLWGFSLIPSVEIKIPNKKQSTGKIQVF